MTGVDFPLLGLILSAACLVAMLCRRVGFPYPVGLVIAGFALALTPWGDSLRLTPELVYDVLLPPLLFEAAAQIDWRSFRRELPLVTVLATVGVLLAALLVAAGMHWLVGWSWLGAVFFGALIAATDPVSVIAAFRENRVDHRLHLLVESESLLNDGIAALGFALIAGVAAGGAIDGATIASSLAWIAVGGLVVGLAVGGFLMVVAGRTRDPLVEISLTVLAAWGSFLLAEQFHMSGVLATVAAGLLVGNGGRRQSSQEPALSDQGQGALTAFWDYAAFLANSVVFILIGSAEASPDLVTAIPVAAVAIVCTLAGRAVAVYPLSLLFARTSLAVPWRFKHLLFWGGLRGALALALALALPASVPERAEIIAAAFLVVAFSIVVQGLTMPLLIRRLGLSREEKSSSKGSRHGREV